MDNDITLNLDSEEQKMIYQVLVEGYFNTMKLPEKDKLYNLAISIENQVRENTKIRIKMEDLRLIISSLRQKKERLDVLGHHSIDDWDKLKKIYKERKLCNELMNEMARLYKQEAR